MSRSRRISVVYKFGRQNFRFQKVPVVLLQAQTAVRLKVVDRLAGSPSPGRQRWQLGSSLYLLPCPS